VLKKNKHIAHFSGGIKRLKHNVRTTLQLAYQAVTHTRKTHQVIRTQMVATARYMIRVFVTFSHC